MQRGGLIFAMAAAAVVVVGGLAWRLSAKPAHNVVIFVADGLRYGAVTPESAPALAAVQREGVDFRNSHSLYPTVTTPNASAIATGHYLGDTGDFGNTIYLGAPALAPVFGSLVANYEDDPTLKAANARFGANYLGETGLLAAARAKGYSTAVIGKLGPVAIQDVTGMDGAGLIVDDSTGTPDGVALPADIVKALKDAKLPTAAPDRGLNTDPGTYIMPGVRVANIDQQDWFTAVATRVVLPRFKAANKPFVLVLWSRDPDGTQHNQGDSLNVLTPGINGPTSKAAIHNASDDLQRLRDTLKQLGLDKTTDIFVTADHGFSTAAKESATSPAAKMRFNDVKPGLLPPGFLAIDLAQALNLPLYEPSGLDVWLKDGFHPKHSSAIVGADPRKPDVVIGANGGSDLIWLPKANAKDLAAKIVDLLAGHDYTGAIFVEDRLGPLPGALPLSAIGLKGSARTPSPSIVVSFRSFSTGCATAELCGAEIADTDLQQGQGIHGSFGRADTRNFMAAVGPSFKAGFANTAPVSNADIAPTAAKILGLTISPRGGLVGRVTTESLKDGQPVQASAHVVRSTPGRNGFTTVLNMQRVGSTPYFDAAGAPGRTLGLRP